MATPTGDRPDTRTRLRYTALQLPGYAILGVLAWAAVRWLELAPWVAVVGLALWAVKDAVMFRYVWPAYAHRDGNGLHDVRGRVGTVEEALAPEGRVRVGSERWRAVGVAAEPSLAVGTKVKVVDIHGLRLTVEADPDAGER